MCYNPSMKKTSSITFRIDANTKLALELIAGDQGRSLSSLLNIILRQWLEKFE